MEQIGSTTYLFRESAWAWVTSREHIVEAHRPVAPVRGGGLTDTALCGAAIGLGRDVGEPVTAERVATGLDSTDRPVCPDCAAVWQQRESAAR